MSKPGTSSLAPLIAIAERAFSHFTDLDGQAFARLPASGSDGCSALPVRSREYREWFYASFFGDHGAVPSSRAFHTLLHHLEAQADADPRCRRVSVFRRIGSRGPAPFPKEILLDLSNPQGEFVEISHTGWRVASSTNVNFQTSRSTDPLPAPVREGSGLHELESLLNFSSRADWLRCLAWLLSAFRPPITPYPVLMLQGPPSSGKSFAARVLRSLIDPSAASLSPIPSTVRELHTLARHNWVLAFDHISTLSTPLADALSRLSAGVGISHREAAAPASEPLLQTEKRPILLTLTERFSCPADLAERALTVTFAPLPPKSRRPEAEFQTILPAARPRILAALCDAISTALRRLPEMTRVTGRCPDALAWALAAAPALGCTEEEMHEAFDGDLLTDDAAATPPTHPQQPVPTVEPNSEVTPAQAPAPADQRNAGPPAPRSRNPGPRSP